MAGPKSSLYPTQLFNYEVCPQKFLWCSGWDGIDLGRGPGKPKARPEDKSKHHALMGIVIQGVLEDFYNKELWKQGGDVEGRLVKMVRERFSNELPRMHIDWTWSPPWEELLETCENGVTGYLKTMKHHKFLGPYAKSEVKVSGHVGDVKIAGKLDFLIQREDTGVSILDGKNSSTKMKYNNPDQLRHYALAFSLEYGRLPNRLGFVWFRYPYDEESGEEGVDWINFTRRDLKELADRAIQAKRGMIREEFPAFTKAKHCNLCDFEGVCPERQAAKEANRAKRAKRKESLPIIDASNGPVDVGFLGELLE